MLTTMHIKKEYLTLLILSIYSTFTMAGEVNADRPGFGTGTHTVQKGRFQIEGGMEYINDDPETNEDKYIYPLTNIRFGISETSELNIYWEGKEESNSTTSYSSSSLGIKKRISKDGEFTSSIMATISLDDDKLVPFAAYLFETSAGDQLSFSGAIQIDFEVYNKKLYSIPQTALGMSYSSDSSLGYFIEAFASLPQRNGENEALWANAGITWIANPSIQLDISVGKNFRKPQNSFLGIGIAKLF